MTRILGIETSCDETAAAVVEDGRKILSNVIASQIALHREYGGVFPEMASRQHVLAITPTIEEAMGKAELDWEELDAIAVTYGPGLCGSLLVGVNAAKGLALGLDLPLIGLNHLEGHIYANWLGTDESPKFPLLCLIVSGGHTELILMSDHGKYKRLGGTLDDAAGEAFDKVGRLLGMNYPGGPAIERAARFGDPTAFDLPRAWLRGSYDFSFSGLKTAMLRIVQKYEEKIAPEEKSSQLIPRAPMVTRQLPVADLAASFQAAVIDVLVEKTRRATEKYRVEQVLLAGGVAANKALREEMAEKVSLPVLCPPPHLCTDNAAMIASAAHFHFLTGKHSGWDLDVVPDLELPTVEE